jgi:hypothetical protein
MTGRLFVPAAFAGLLATMPPASATPQDRQQWLETTYRTLRREFPGPRGLMAMRLARVIDTARHAIRDEIATATTVAA